VSGWFDRLWPMTRADANRLINQIESESVTGIFAVILETRRQVDEALAGIALPADVRTRLATIFDESLAEAHRLATNPGVSP